METMKKSSASYSTVIDIAGYSIPFCLCTKTGICCKFTVFPFRSLVIQIKPISRILKQKRSTEDFSKVSPSFSNPPPSDIALLLKEKMCYANALMGYCCFLPNLVVPSILRKFNLKNDLTPFSGHRWDSAPKFQMLTEILSRHNSDIKLYLVCMMCNIQN